VPTRGSPHGRGVRPALVAYEHDAYADHDSRRNNDGRRQVAQSHLPQPERTLTVLCDEAGR